MTNKREIEPIMITTTKGIRNCTCSNFISYYISCFLQIRSHDRQCCPDCYWNPALFSSPNLLIVFFLFAIMESFILFIPSKCWLSWDTLKNFLTNPFIISCPLSHNSISSHSKLSHLCSLYKLQLWLTYYSKHIKNHYKLDTNYLPYNLDISKTFLLDSY